MNDCGNCRHTNHLGLPDWSTMPCAACAKYGADNDPTMWEEKPQTNYDRIISKTPEELADWMNAVLTSNVAPYATIRGANKRGKLLDWLKQEATE